MLMPKEQPKMELTEEQCRRILQEYCDMVGEDCKRSCKFIDKPAPCLDVLERFSTDEVFAAVRELAGGDGE